MHFHKAYGLCEPAFGRSACCSILKYQGQEHYDEMHSGKADTKSKRVIHINIYDQASVAVCSYASLASFE